MSDVISGEIARLHHRFVVSVDPSRHPGSKVVSLLCRLGKSAMTENIIVYVEYEGHSTGSRINIDNNTAVWSTIIIANSLSTVLKLSSPFQCYKVL